MAKSDELLKEMGLKWTGEDGQIFLNEVFSKEIYEATKEAFDGSEFLFKNSLLDFLFRGVGRLEVVDTKKFLTYVGVIEKGSFEFSDELLSMVGVHLNFRSRIRIDSFFIDLERFENSFTEGSYLQKYYEQHIFGYELIKIFEKAEIEKGAKKLIEKEVAKIIENIGQPPYEFNEIFNNAMENLVIFELIQELEVKYKKKKRWFFF